MYNSDMKRKYKSPKIAKNKLKISFLRSSIIHRDGIDMLENLLVQSNCACGTCGCGYTICAY